MIKTRKVAMLSVATAGLALGAACSDSGGGSANAGQVPQATGNAVSAQPTSLGTILVDGKGRTVYGRTARPQCPRRLLRHCRPPG